MVEKHETCIKNIKYDICNHLADQFQSTFNPIFNYKLGNKIFDINSSRETTQQIVDLRRGNLGSIIMSNMKEDWTAFHNQHSINHHNKNAGDGCVFNVEFTKSGRFMGSSNHFNSIDVWDVDARKLYKSFNFHSEIVTGIDFLSSPYDTVESKDEIEFENEIMISCSLDKTIKLSKNGKILHELKNHNNLLRCINVNNSSKLLLSGCTSSVVKLWDLETLKVKLSIIEESAFGTNTVNTVKFFNVDPNLFINAFREGSIQIYDLRQNSRIPVCHFKGHSSKLNSVKLSWNDRYLLSSGRDNVGRLWDMRMLPSDINTVDTDKVLNTFKGHKCLGYNIEFNYLGKDAYCMTGSEEGSIFVYDIMTSKIVKQFKTNERCVNLAKPMPSNKNSFGFIYSGLENLNIYFVQESWKEPLNDSLKKHSEFSQEIQPSNFHKINSQVKEISEQEEKEDRKSAKNEITTIFEELMIESGDVLLRLIHSSNISPSNLNIEYLLSNAISQGNTEIMGLIQALFNRLLQKKSAKTEKDSNEGKNKNNIEERIPLLCTSCKIENSISNDYAFIRDIDYLIQDDSLKEDLTEDMFTLPTNLFLSLS